MCKLLWKKNYTNPTHQIILIDGKKEEINPSNLPPNEHYKIIMPKLKQHPPYKEIKPEEFFKLEDSYDYKKMKETGKDKYIYNICLILAAKFENLYIRDFIEYYLKMGVEKFYFGDDNPEEYENLGDILDDYIKKGIVDIEYIYHLNLTHHYFDQNAFNSTKFRCKWFIFFDVDEYIGFSDKNMNIKTYLDMPVFDKCDTIRVHWMIHDDNNLLYYDKRPVMERFPNQLPNHPANIYHKPIVRGKDYGKLIFPNGAHEPESSIVSEQCDADGNFEKVPSGIMCSPKFKYAWINHYTYRTAEEFALKLLRGIQKGTKYNYEQKLDDFFKINKFSEEKVNVVENIVKTKFPKYHNNNNN